MHPPTLKETLLSSRPLQGIIILAFVVRIILLVFLHDSYYTADMAQGELARNLAEGRGFVINESFSAEIGRVQKERNALVDIKDVLAIAKPVDSPENLRPFIAYMMPGHPNDIQLGFC